MKNRASVMLLVLFLPLLAVLVVALGFVVVIGKHLIRQAGSQVIAISEPPPRQHRRTSRPIAVTDTAV